MAARLALTLLIWALCGAPRAHAEASFAPTYAEARARSAAETSERLERMLLALPDVVSARVHLTVVDDSHLPLDLPRPKPRLAAFVGLKGKGPSDAELTALLSSAAPGLTASEMRIVRQAGLTQAATPPERALVEVGPFRVAPESATALRMLLAALLTVIALLCAVIVWRGPRSKA